MFPINVFPFTYAEKLVAEKKIASPEAKMFLNKFRNILVGEALFLYVCKVPHMFPAQETLFWWFDMCQQYFKILES